MTCLYLIVFPCSSYNFSCWFLDAELTLNPNWSPFFVGESVKMTCNLHKQKKLDWKYTFSRNGEQFDLCSNNSSCSLKLFGNYSGEYQCTAQRASEKPIKSNKVNLLIFFLLRRSLLTEITPRRRTWVDFTSTKTGGR